MNEHRTRQGNTAAAPETAADIFARIQRQRTESISRWAQPQPETDTPAPAGQAGTSDQPRSHAGRTEEDAVADLRAALASLKAASASTRPTDDSELQNSAFNEHSRSQGADNDPAATVHLERIDPSAEPAETIDADPGFPRSMTMRTLMRYPALGLVAAVPVATVLLKSPRTRRTLYRIGRYALEQQLWKQAKRLL